MYYIRKLSSSSNKYKIQQIKDVEHIESDFVKQELGTISNTLSFWKCEDLKNILDTIKAILLSTTSISTSEFIIIPSKLVEENGLKIEDEEGKTAYKGFENLHVNVCNLTYKRLSSILKVYKSALSDKDGSCKYYKDDIKSYINDVIKNDLLDESKLQDHLKKDIQKYCF